MSNSARKPAGLEKARLFDQVARVMHLVQQGKRDPKKVSFVLQGIIANSEITFDDELKISIEQRIPDLFISPRDQLGLVRARNEARGWGFTEEQLDSVHLPAWPGEGLRVVVLDVSLETVERTFEEAWYLTCQAQENHNGAGNFREKDMKSDSAHLRLLEGAIFHPMSLRWYAIDLIANQNKEKGVRVEDVRSPIFSPHSAILWAASYFPKWIQAMDNNHIPSVQISGYQVDTTRAPLLSWFSDVQEVTLMSRRIQDRGNWTVPEILGV